MAQATDTDLREVRELILNLDKKIDSLIARTDERFSGLESSLNQRMDALEQHSRNQDIRLRWCIGILGIMLLGLGIKLVFAAGNLT